MHFYGLWLIVATVPAFIAMGDFGFSSAAERHMTIFIAQGRREEALVFYHSAAAIVASVAAPLCAASFLVFLGDPTTFLLIDKSVEETFKGVIVLLVSSAAVALLRNNLMSVFRSEGRYTFAAFSGAMVEGSQAAISFAVILAGGGPLAIAAVIFVCQGLAYLVLTILARRSVAWFRGATDTRGFWPSESC